jgi:hypothetical protein
MAAAWPSFFLAAAGTPAPACEVAQQGFEITTDISYPESGSRSTRLGHNGTTLLPLAAAVAGCQYAKQHTWIEENASLFA